MGQVFSTASNENESENSSSNADTNRQQSPASCGVYFGSNVPRELSQESDDCKHWYADFFEQAYVAPHRDGKSVVVFWPDNERYYDGDDEKTVIMRAAKIYERLFLDGGGHPRLVK